MTTITSVSNAFIGDSLQDLRHIHAPAVNIAVCQRSVHHLKVETDALLDCNIKFRGSGSPSEVQNALQNYFYVLDLDLPLILDDVVRLLDVFRGVSKSDKFQVLLSTVKTNMCRKFHTDINDLRMICTYSGKGTLWLSEEGVKRGELEKQIAEGSVMSDSRFIRHAQAGDVLILKGALYPSGAAVIHRSPTIEADGEKRLFLRVDINEKFGF